MKRISFFRAVCVLVVGMITIMGCTNEADVLPNEPSNVTEDEVQTEGPSPKIILNFSEILSAKTLNVRYSLSDVQIKEQMEQGLIVYTKEAEDAELFIGISSEGNVTEIAPLFEEHYLPDVSVEKIDAFGEDMTAIQAICGASCAVTYLLSAHQDTYQLYSISGGLEYVDLDNDGNVDVIGHTGSTISEIELYRMHENQIKKVNINKALEATEGVVFNADLKTFETWLKGQRVQYTFNAKDYSLNLVSDSK